MKKYFILFLLIVTKNLGYSQTKFSYNFYQNLLNSKEIKLGILYLNKCSNDSNNYSSFDSINFLKGMYYFNSKEFSNSVLELGKIHQESVYFNQSKIHQAIGLCYLDSSEKFIFNELKSVNGDSIFNNIKTMIMASSALINNNTSIYDSLAQGIKDSLYYYNSLQTTLGIWRNKSTKKTKSPIVAASLSALAPGLGKVYAGKPYDGLGTFLTHIPLGFIIWESYSGAGINSARFIAFTSISSLFYFGNIVSSYFYVYKGRKEVNNDKKNEILLHCNIMLRNYFN